MEEFNLESRIGDVLADLDTLWAVGIKPWIFDFSVGIGRNVAEAEVAMKEAKSRHKKGRPFDPIESTRYALQMLNNDFSGTDLIGIYSEKRPMLPETDFYGPRLKEQVEDSIQRYMRLTPAQRELVWPETRKLCYDVNTSAYTNWGIYFIDRLIQEKDTLGIDFLDDALRNTVLTALEREEAEKDKNIYSSFWDGNNMKGYNSTQDMDDVTLHIDVGAAALVHSSRASELFSTVPISRKNGNNGDEFFQKRIACYNIKEIYDAVKRLMHQSGMAQLNLYKSELEDFYSKKDLKR